MKKLLALGVLLLVVFASHTEGAAAPQKPNILWLIAEDMGSHLGCYGTKEVWTPNLDKMAKEGVLYTRAYTTAPVCSPSRSAFMTGMYQTTIDAHNHRSHRNDNYQLPDGVRLLTDHLREAGYYTANLQQLPFGFKGTGKTDWNFKTSDKPFKTSDKPFDSNRWADLKEHQPFYAQINFHETHRDFNGAKKANPAKVEIPPYYPDHKITRRDWADYLDAASELDRKIGLILDRLEKDGLADDTIILFFGDNGAAHVRAKQFCYEEGLNVPMIVRWPKNYPSPAQITPSKIDDRFIEAIDFAPTMLDIAGVAKPAKMQGRIFLGQRSEAPRQYVFGARDRCDETVMRLRTVRDTRYRYIRNFTPQVPFLAPNAYKEKQYPVWNLLKELHAQGKLTPPQEFLCQPTQPAEELYDLQSDPWEIHNLAADPAHAATLLNLRTVLDKWMVDTDDRGRFPEQGL